MGMKMIPWPRWRSTQTGQRRIKTIKTRAFTHPSSLLTGPVRRQLTDRAARRGELVCLLSVLQGVCWSRGSTRGPSTSSATPSPKSGFSILDSKLRLEEQIPHFCSVKKWQSLYTCGVWMLMPLIIQLSGGCGNTSEMNPPTFICSTSFSC